MALMTDTRGNTAEFQLQWSVIYWDADSAMMWHSNYYELSDAKMVTDILRKDNPEWVVKILRYIDY